MVSCRWIGGVASTVASSTLAVIGIVAICLALTTRMSSVDALHRSSILRATHSSINRRSSIHSTTLNKQKLLTAASVTNLLKPTLSTSTEKRFDLSDRVPLLICSCSSNNGEEIAATTFEEAPEGSSSPNDIDPLNQARGPRVASGSTFSGSLTEALNRLNLSAEAAPPDFIMLGENGARYGDLSMGQIEFNIQERRNRIFQLMEEVRRLRIQQRIKAKAPGMRGTQTVREMQEQESFPSAIPNFPPITKNTIQDYKRFYSIATPAVIIFGGLIAPLLEVRMGLGGASYYDFITSVGLPAQLAEVDPIVASFCGGMVGVLTALLLVEVNNANAQAASICTFCSGAGYLTCGICGGSGINPETGGMCENCGNLGKVICTSCAATGKKVFTEHDPRIDPFN
mmetsp:Transcript_16873/g.27418  ORF Transcript_16873/g.27418 Transcript_16873/m.27418 type:complete len:399 (+) Transcript_16873:254-1450(+)